MNYENKVYNYSDKLPIKERNYSYYMINNKDKNHHNHNFSNSFNGSNNDNNLLSSNMRMSNIESRLSTMEKMMKYFDEFIHLKEEEKLNNLSSLEITSNIPSYLNGLTTKINRLEKELDNLKKQKRQSEIENSKIIENLQNKVNFLEQIINNNKNNFDSKKKNNINKKNNLNCLMEQNDIEKFNKNAELEEFMQNKLNEIYSNKCDQSLLKETFGIFPHHG